MIQRADSMFEAEFAYLKAARQLFPDDSRSLLDPWQCWYLRLDCSRGTWATVTLLEAAHPDADALCVGPMANKYAPPKLGEHLDDVFDLCRYPAELAKTPHARPCPYQEMGRCPAPCNGSEPWHQFLARFANAAGSLRSLEQLRTGIDARMLEASRSSQFERASHLKEVLDAIKGRRGAALEHIGFFHAFARVAVVPCRAGAHQIYLCRPDGLRSIGGLDAKPSPAGCQAIADQVASIVPLDPAYRPSAPQLDEFAFITHRLFLARRTETYLTLAEATDPDILRRTANRRRRPEQTMPDNNAPRTRNNGP